MKTKTEQHYYCSFCNEEYTDPDYIINTHEPECTCNPKNNPCKKCSGHGKRMISNPCFEFDNGEYPFLNVKCLECDGKGKNIKNKEITITNNRGKKTNCFKCKFFIVSKNIHECSFIKRFIDEPEKMHCEVFHEGTPQKEEEYED